MKNTIIIMALIGIAVVALLYLLNGFELPTIRSRTGDSMSGLGESAGGAMDRVRIRLR